MKKVLIINASAIGKNNGTGVTLRNIWKDYPRENLLQVIIDWNDTEKDVDIPTILTPIEFCRIPYTIHRTLNKNRKGSGGVANGSVKQNGMRACLRDCLRGILDAFPVKYRCIMDQVRAFSPDVIYTCGASIRILKTANYIAKRLGIPIVLHLMDDWPETIYTASFLSSGFHRKVKRQLKKMHERCGMNLAISAALAKKYSEIYGVEYQMLMNPAMNIEKQVQGVSSEPKFLYAGSLNLNRWKSLLDIARVLDGYREKGVRLEFTLYVPQYDAEFYGKEFQKYGAAVHPYVPAEQLREIYRENDVLVLAESFDRNVIEYTKYSLSTKIPEYMSTGCLILAYLPEELHSFQYLKESELAVMSSTTAELEVAVEKIVSRSDECCVLAENSLKKAQAIHSVKACRERLLAAINQRKGLDKNAQN